MENPGDLIRPEDRLVMVVGNYGSGKTEVAVHLALRLAAAGRAVSIADLDLVNPYFRCREARGLMEARGIRVVVPPPSLEFADLPIVLPEIYGMLRPAAGTHAIFDVGGDDVGARALGSLRCALGEAPYELWQVINACRPFTNTIGGCVNVQQSIENAARLAVTGYVVNTHLMEHTTAETVRDGWELARALSQQTGLPIRGVAVPAPLQNELADLGAPLLPLTRTVPPPWLKKGDHVGSHRD